VVDWWLYKIQFLELLFPLLHGQNRDKTKRDRSARLGKGILRNGQRVRAREKDGNGDGKYAGLCGN
jgi:hypothetical protein